MFIPLYLLSISTIFKMEKLNKPKYGDALPSGLHPQLPNPLSEFSLPKKLPCYN